VPRRRGRLKGLGGKPATLERKTRWAEGGAVIHHGPHRKCEEERWKTRPWQRGEKEPSRHWSRARDSKFNEGMPQFASRFIHTRSDGIPGVGVDGGPLEEDFTMNGRT